MERFGHTQEGLSRVVGKSRSHVANTTRLLSLPEPVLAALQKASTEVMEEEAQKDALFAEAYKSLSAYVKRVGRWSDLQALPRSK